MTRETRQEAVAADRRRRKNSTLDRMQGLKMALPPEFEGDKEHHYYWANDTNSRVYDLTVRDDYDVVRTAKPEASDEDRVRLPVGSDENGQPVYAVLLRKPIESRRLDMAEREAAIREHERSLQKNGAPTADGSERVNGYALADNKLVDAPRVTGYIP